MTIMPSTVYVVLRDYSTLGIGCSDPAFDADDAYDQFVEAVNEGQAVTVWRIDTYGGLPVRITEETDRFENEMQELCMSRKLVWNEVVRFNDALPRYAAE